MQQDHSILFTEENASVKPQKKKTYKKKAAPTVQSQENGVFGLPQLQGPPARTGKKGSKRMAKTDVPPLLHQPERSASDSLPDSSASGDEYRALRRQYLLMEEESFRLGNQLRELETEVLMLEDEKDELLDELVVLEGLVNPSELQNQGLGSPKIFL